MSACCICSVVESTSRESVNTHLSRSNKAEAKCIALQTKDLAREKVVGGGGASLHIPANGKCEAKAFFSPIYLKIMR